LEVGKGGEIACLKWENNALHGLSSYKLNVYS
jgi:hypothetical protein